MISLHGNNLMYKRICFLYTETTGLHQVNESVSKKKLFGFARMVTLNYEIGYVKDKEFIQEKMVKQIVKPRCMFIPKETVEFHGITQEIANQKGVDPEVVISQLKDELKTVDIIVSHNVDFHLRTILAEAVRYNINLDFSKFLIIDTINFSHDYGFVKLKELAGKVGIKNIPTTNESNVELIRDVFFKLYTKFKKSIEAK
jgi:DNA polymerase III epsilon subunit-like protein